MTPHPHDPDLQLDGIYQDQNLNNMDLGELDTPYNHDPFQDEMDNLGNDTLTVFTSDHGEEFWEHGLRGHGKTLHRAAVRVPLIVRWPGHVPPGRHATPVQLVDLVPTLANLVGIEKPPVLHGRDLFDDAPRVPAYSSLDHDGHRFASLRSKEWVLLRDLENERDHLFRAGSDERAPATGPDVEVIGLPLGPRSISRWGKRRRSTLPVGVRGISSRRTRTLGIM